MKRFSVFSVVAFFGGALFFSSFSSRELSSQEEKRELLPVDVPALPRSEPQKRTCLSVLKKISLMALDKTALIGITTLGAWAGAEWAGHQSGTPLVGLSIYLDYDSVLNQLTTDERAILEAPQKDVDRIADILNTHLSHRSSDDMELWPYLRPLMASSYFSENPPKANVCRHKALILKAILNHLNIPAKLVTGTIQGDEGTGSHVWVYLPSIDKVADPMNGSLIAREQYMKSFNAKETFGIIHFSKPVGIMVR